MPLQTIKIGTIPNDNTGDSIRDAFLKTNSNFSYLQTEIDERISVTNLGVGKELFVSKVGSNLRFKTISNSNKIILTETDNELNIDTHALDEITIQGNSGYITVNENNFNLIVEGGNNISVVADNNKITINSTHTLFKDTTPTLSNDLNINLHNITGKGNINIEGSIIANNINGVHNGQVYGSVEGNTVGVHTGPVYGDLYGLVYGKNIFDIIDEYTNIDFGAIGKPVSTVLDLLLFFLNLDMGYILNPSNILIDIGIIYDDEPIIVTDNGELVLLGGDDELLIT